MKYRVRSWEGGNSEGEEKTDGRTMGREGGWEGTDEQRIGGKV